MQTFLDAIADAFRLIVTLDPDVLDYTARSLIIALSATLLASVLGVPLGMLIATHRFPGKRVVVTILNTLLALPTVVVGLTVYSLLSRSGPLGSLQLLFTVPGIVIGEVLLVLPIVTAFSLAAISRTDRDIRKTALACGASRRQVSSIVFFESRFGIVAAMIAAFGRVVSEVGVAMIVGGNIDGFTRTMTTAVATIHDMGDFVTALALGMVLLAVALSVNVVLQFLQGGAQE